MSPPRLLPALLGGTFIGILTALPVVGLANCCCLWLISGGVLAAWVTQQNHPAPITVGDGAIAGVLAAIVGAIVYAVVATAVATVTGPIMAGLADRALRSARDLPPEVADLVRELGAGSAGILVGSIFWLVLGVIFSPLGGVLGAVIFRRPAPRPEPSPPPPAPDADTE